MRRLFSTFARGWPALGLLLMRIAAGGSLILDGIERSHTGQMIEPAILCLLMIGDGALLVVGLWTPISGSLLVALSAWKIFTHQDSSSHEILLAAMGAALALVGPGAASIDAWLFGWKRLDLEK